jgi:hypothetical protein
MRLSEEKLRNSPSFQQSIEHGPYWIELLARRSAESRTFATFVYPRSSERLLRYFTNSDENEVIWQGHEIVRAEFVKFDQELSAAPELE